MIVVLVCLAAVFATAAALVLRKRHGRAPRTPMPPKTADPAREREAFYMQNFWSYDGSEQEEFDE